MTSSFDGLAFVVQKTAEQSAQDAELDREIRESLTRTTHRGQAVLEVSGFLFDFNELAE